MAQRIPEPSAIVAVALCGALIGFAPFNRPVARVFLGDVGSLRSAAAWMVSFATGVHHT